MTDTLAMVESVLPPYLILACRNVEPGEQIAVLVINDEPQQLLEAFSCKDVEEACLIQMALEKRHPNANFVCLSPHIMIRLFNALMLSDDGSALHQDVFENRIKRVELDPTSIEAIRQMLKRFYDEAKATSFNVLPDVVETYFGALMALMGIKEDE